MEKEKIPYLPKLLKIFSIGFVVFSILTYQDVSHGITQAFGDTFLEGAIQTLGTYVIEPINFPGIFSFLVIIFCVGIFIRYIVKLLKNREKSSLSFTKKLKGKLTWEFVVLAFLVSIAFFIRLKSIGFTSCVTDTFVIPNVGANLAEHGVFGGLGGFFPAYVTPAGHHSFERAFLYSLSTVLPFKAIGISDFSARLPAMIFGSISVFLVYKIGKFVSNKWVGLISASLMAFSGWSIFISTFSRDYILLVTFTLLSLYTYLKYRNERTNWNFFLFCFSLGLLLSVHKESLFIFLTFLFFGVVDFLVKNERTEFFSIKVVASLLVFLSLILLIWQPIPQYKVWIIQYSDYHLGAENLVAFMAITVFGTISLLREKWGQYPVTLFYLPFILIPYSSYLVRPMLYPRYTAPFYPFFLIFLASFIFFILKKTTSVIEGLIRVNRGKLLGIFSLTLVVFIVFSIPGFVSPHEKYSKRDIYPDFYELRNYEMKGEMKNHPLEGFKYGYKKIIGPTLDESSNDNIAVIEADWNALYWYTRVNKNTRDDRMFPFMLEIGYQIPTYAKKHYNLPVLSSLSEFENIKKKYERGFVLISGYGRVSQEFRSYLEDNLKMELKVEEIEVYSWFQ